MIIIKGNFLKIILGLAILFICLGAVCAGEDNQTYVSLGNSPDSTAEFDEIEELITDSPDNGSIELGEKEYALDSNRTVKINKSLTINGITDRTVIEGNNNTLFLDAFEEEKNTPSDGFILIFPDDGLKKTGKHIVFNNITFKNIILEKWHEMEFNGCTFINSTLVSHEMNTRFDGCIFKNSNVKPDVIIGYDPKKVPPVFTEILNCLFVESQVKTQAVYTPMYMHLVGSDFFRIYANANISNTSFHKSKISVNDLNISITDTLFNATDIDGHSNSINIDNCEFLNQNINFGICVSRIENSKFNASAMNLHASYFSIGSSTDFKSCNLSNSKIKVSPGFRSRKSQISFDDSLIEKSYLDATDTSVSVKSSSFDESEMLLFFSDLKISDSIISKNATVLDTIKTKLSEVKEFWVDGKSENRTVNYQIKTDYQCSNTYFVNESGKYELKSEDISKNTLYNFTWVAQDIYYQNDMLIFVLKDQNGTPVADEEIYVGINDNYYYSVPSLKTDKNGIAKYRIEEIGNLEIHAFYYSEGFNFDRIRHEITFRISVKSRVYDMKVSKCDFGKNAYSTIEGYLRIKLLSKTHEDLSNIKLTVKIKNKTYRITTDSSGIEYFDIPRKLNAGSYNLKISVAYTNITKTVKFKVSKAKTKVSAPKLTAKYKKSQFFKVTIKNKITKKAVSKIKVKIRVYTGKKCKVYSAKTDKKGLARINTKNLKAGKHRVVISSANKNYSISAKSGITIKK